MEPKIRYATTSDGVDIAYASAGEGPPLLMLSTPGVSHVQAVWERPVTSGSRSPSGQMT